MQEIMDQIVKWFDSPFVRSVLFVVTATVCVGFLVRILRKSIQNRIRDNETRYRASKLVSVAGYFIVLIILLAELGLKLSGFALALGAASAGIAFALQEVIVSFAGWLAIAMGGFYRVGDRVQLGGIKGDVIDIGFIRTTIMEIGSWVSSDLYNGRIVRVANSFVFKEPVYNYSGEFPFVWDEIVLPIKYGSDYEAARAILDRVAQEVVGEYVERASLQWRELVKLYRIEDARVDPFVTIVANDNWVEFTLRYVVDYRLRRSTKDRLFTKILQDIEGSGGRVGMASATVHLVEAPPLHVSVDSAKSQDS